MEGASPDGQKEWESEKDGGEVVDISVNLEEDRDVLKTVYELFHSEVGDIPLLTATEERELSRRIMENGDSEAFERFVLGNLRLVIACAKKVKDRMGQQGIMSFMDMVQEGMLGLMIAVKRFDYRRNTRFSTYGIPWIYQRIKMAMLQQRHGMTVPGYAGISVHALSGHIQAYKSGRLEAIPKDVDIERIKALARISSVTVPIDYSDENGNDDYSLSPEKLGNSEDPLSGVVDGDQAACEIEETLFGEKMMKHLRERLSEKEYDVLCRRFGVGLYECPQMLSDIASCYGKSSEHVRSIVRRAMETLEKDVELWEFCRSWGLF